MGWGIRGGVEGECMESILISGDGARRDDCWMVVCGGMRHVSNRGLVQDRRSTLVTWLTWVESQATSLLQRFHIEVVC